MRDTLKLSLIQFLIVIPLILNKLARRLFLNDDTHDLLKVFLFSFPNLLEAIVGVLLLTILGLMFSRRWLSPQNLVNEHVIYLAAIFLSGAFIITQELNIYNWRGDNVVDPYDVVFSIIGLTLSYALLLFMRPRIHEG